MKVSVSIPEEDVEFLDAYAAAQGISSRSAVVHKAVRLLKASEMGSSYEDAFQDWEESGEGAAWEATVDDGMA